MIGSHIDAIALAVGEIRPADGLTFAEFAKHRYGRLCPQYDLREVHFQAGTQQPGGYTLYEILMFRESRERQRGDCGLPKLFNIAWVDPSTGEVYPEPAQRPDINYTHWLTEFREGAEP